MIPALRSLAAALDVLPGWVWALLCAGAISALAVTGYQLNTERTAHAETRDAHAQAAQKAEAQAREREHTAAQTLATIQQKAKDENQALRRRAAALADSLRHRPERPAGSDVPEGAADPVACTGAQLYRQDGELLVRLAGDADQLRIDLAACRAAYDAAVALTN